MTVTEAQLAQRLSNVERIAAERRQRTHCKRGHELTPENTVVKNDLGWRECLTCKRDRAWYWTRGLVMSA